MKATFAVTGLLLIGLLAGCAAAVVGGTAAGVSVVHDRRTAGTIIEDQAIELKAINVLSQDAQLKKAHVNATSYNNKVLLTGQVPTPELRRQAERLVSRIDKVQRVYNHLDVTAPSSMASRGSDTWITTKVKSSLFRIDGLPGFDPTRVKVVTERGVVYLFGLLTPQEAEAVIRTARRVGGVQKVVTLFETIEDRS